jgi:hypothetical protein
LTTAIGNCQNIGSFCSLDKKDGRGKKEEGRKTRKEAGIMEYSDEFKAELDRRLKDYLSGKAKTYNSKEVKDGIQKLLKKTGRKKKRRIKEKTKREL